MAKHNKTHEERLTELEFKDERRDGHINEIRKDVKAIAEMQKEFLIILGGTSLNKNKGALSMLEEVKSKMTEVEKVVNNHTNDLSQVKFWGRGSAGIIFVSLGLVIKKIFNI